MPVAKSLPAGSPPPPKKQAVEGTSSSSSSGVERQPLQRCRPVDIEKVEPGSLIDAFFPDPSKISEAAEAETAVKVEEYVDDSLYCPNCHDPNLPGTIYCVRCNTALQVDLVDWSPDDPTQVGTTRTFHRGESQALDYLVENNDPDIEELGDGNFRAHAGALARANNPTL
jgi:hypothetical protein